MIGTRLGSIAIPETRTSQTISSVRRICCLGGWFQGPTSSPLELDQFLGPNCHAHPGAVAPPYHFKTRLAPRVAHVGWWTTPIDSGTTQTMVHANLKLGWKKAVWCPYPVGTPTIKNPASMGGAPSNTQDCLDTNEQGALTPTWAQRRRRIGPSRRTRRVANCPSFSWLVGVSLKKKNQRNKVRMTTISRNLPVSMPQGHI